MTPVESSLPFVSVIVTARNEGEALRDCLASVARIDYPADRHETLVVDNASTDLTAEIIRGYPVTYLYESRVGICQARNRGIEESRGEIFAFTDPDCVVSKGWLRGMVRRFADPSVGAVAGGIVPYPPNTLPELHASRRRSHSQERPLNYPVLPFAMTPNVAFRREVFERIGAFDTRFPGGGWEDADISWRLQRLTRFAIEYAPEAIVFHRYRDSYGRFVVQHYRYGFGLGLLTLKYRDEVSRGWAAHPQSLIEIPEGIWKVAKAALGFLHRADREILGLRYLDLLRVLAQRSGYLAARLQRREM